LLGEILYFCFPRRRRILLANLRHAFPEISTAQIRRLAHINAHRLVEMGIFTLISPHLSPAAIQRRFSLEGPWQAVATRLRDRPSAQLLLIPHQTYSEALTFLPVLLDLRGATSPIAVLYRPFSNGKVEQFMKKTRERFGVRLLSRRGGLVEAARLLARKGCVGLLFDQHVQTAGVQTLLCGRVVRSTPLPEILRQRGDVSVGVAWAERRGMGRAVLHVEALDCAAQDTIFAMNHWLEKKLARNVNFAQNWLWVHNRWKEVSGQWLTIQDRGNGRKNLLDRNLSYLGLARLPKKFHIWIRLPDGPEELERAIPLLQSIRRGRPDGFLTLFCTPAQRPKVRSLSLGDEVRPFSRKLFGRFRPANWPVPDLFLNLSHSFLADWQAFLARAPVRMGFCRKGAWRPFLSHRLPLPANAGNTHWWRALEEFGLDSKNS
jgi:lauroyl/myristoyl acyltransferase